MFIHRQYDISVLFSDTKSAAAAWEKTMGSTDLERERQHRGVPCQWKLHLQMMPQEELDTRLLPTVTSGAWISVDADLTGYYQSAIQRFEGGLMDAVGEVVAQLLNAGGSAVVLHKAAACVKPADRFLREFNAGMGGPLPWIDLLTTQNEETICRTYGMPHYVGKPNIHAHCAHVDVFAAERCYRATMTAVFRGIVDELIAPMWFDDSPAIVWQAEHNDEELAVHLRSQSLEAQHPAVTWPQTDFEMYSLLVADLAAVDFRGSQFRFFDSILLETEIPCRILCFECAHVILYVTAGFGRVATKNGSEENATIFAEFAAFGPSDVAMVKHLHMLASIAHDSEVSGGVKDYDIISPATNMDGYLAMPLHDLPFGPQPIALRVLCPFFAFERPEMALNPRAWCDANLGKFTDIYDRWTQTVSREP